MESAAAVAVAASADEDTETTNPRTMVAVILGGGAGIRLFPLTKRRPKPTDAKSKDIEDVLILSGDHLYRMDYMDFVQFAISLGV
ncbi:hypothetical protein ZWY2020_003660 [Hordeum vulgare]|nr:hypothetical protein ZWY2020_003660 [Hordeum vulgare]